jgi:hypothetical protein
MDMPETLLTFPLPLDAPDGTAYEARACGAETPAGTWEGWLEFVPRHGEGVVRTPRETTQPNRTDTVYWATGLSHVYLEGALKRALQVPPRAAAARSRDHSVFSTPTPSPVHPGANRDSVLDPFSVYEKGEAVLRNQLGALASWHLVNIALDYELTSLSVDALNRMPVARSDRPHRRRRAPGNRFHRSINDPVTIADQMTS